LEGIKSGSVSFSSFAHDFEGQLVAWFTDNQNVASIVNSGSRLEQLLSLALEIFALCTTIAFHSK